MQLQSTDFERWQQPLPAAVPLRAKATGAARSAVGGKDLTRRLPFLTADGQTATGLEQEALLGTNDLVEASFLERCRLVIGCVGRVRFVSPGGGRSYATGFLVAPGLMMTNHHVFPVEDNANGAAIEFGHRYDIAGQLPPTVEFELRPREFFVADQTLDFAVVAVAARSAAGAALAPRYLRLNPESGKAEETDFVTIVQHPDGEPMRIALRENEVIRALQQEEVIWYQADTAHGSSGAPVFNDSFQIAALHSSGRIKRNENGEYALRRGGWAKSTAGLKESDVVWEANVGIRISRICPRLLDLARQRSRPHCAALEAAMQGGDVLSTAIEQAKAGVAEGESVQGGPDMSNKPIVTTSSPMRLPSQAGDGAGLLIPLQLRVSLELVGGGAAAVQPAAGVAAAEAGLEREAMRMQIPIIYDELETRTGFDDKFLELNGSAAVPVPELTARGEAVAAPLIDGSGKQLRYHKFSVWMHKARRLALFTASNVDWRNRKPSIDGKKLTRDSLAGFPPNVQLAEQWVSDPRIAPEHQLPDVFYTEDRGSFDKGHLVRRDDVCWGTSFEDIQMGNGDTYHVTNCSPQTKPFNQGPEGQENWGDLESHVQAATKRDKEKVVIFAGPIFGRDDRWFRGKDVNAAVRVQIPSRFWKIVVAKGPSGKPEAYGFVLEQDVRAITEKEFFVTDEWIGSMRKIADIEAALRGWISLKALKPIDQFAKVTGGS